MCQEAVFKNKTKQVTDTSHKMQSAHTEIELGLDIKGALTAYDEAMVFYPMPESACYFF